MLPLFTSLYCPNNCDKSYMDYVIIEWRGDKYKCQKLDKGIRTIPSWAKYYCGISDNKYKAPIEEIILTWQEIGGGIGLDIERLKLKHKIEKGTVCAMIFSEKITND